MNDLYIRRMQKHHLVLLLHYIGIIHLEYLSCIILSSIETCQQLL